MTASSISISTSAVSVTRNFFIAIRLSSRG
jgi:hypothetical protein